MAYTEKQKTEIIDSICSHIENGVSLRDSIILVKPNLGKNFYVWIDKDKDKSEQYARACEVRQQVLFEEIIKIADNAENDTVQRNRLQIDARKWVLSKMNPKKYGDKLDIDQKVETKEYRLTDDQVKKIHDKYKDEI